MYMNFNRKKIYCFQYSVSFQKIADETGTGIHATLIRDRCLLMAHSVLECAQCEVVEKNQNKNTIGFSNFSYSDENTRKHCSNIFPL